MEFVSFNIVRIFANDIQNMEEKKDYTVTQEQLARFAKAESVLFWGYSRRAPYR